MIIKNSKIDRMKAETDRFHKIIKGTNMLEYALLFAVVVAAIVGTQIYLKRAISGRWRQAADVFGYGRQYESTSPAEQLKIWGK